MLRHRRSKKFGRARCVIEKLEERSLMSASLVGHVLVVEAEIPGTGEPRVGVQMKKNEPIKVFVNGNESTFSGDIRRIKILGTPASDVIVVFFDFGAGMPTTVYGFAGDDKIQTSIAHDVIYGGAGDDQVSSGIGNDRIYGGAGNDTIVGGDGNDVILGAAGNDMIYGGSGKDTLIGGDGADLLVHHDPILPLESYPTGAVTINTGTLSSDKPVNRHHGNGLVQIPINWKALLPKLIVPRTGYSGSLTLNGDFGISGGNNMLNGGLLFPQA